MPTPRRWPPSTHPTMSSRRIVLVAILCAIGAATAPTDCPAQMHQGDRFGLRVGVWPQRAISGILGSTQLSKDDTTHYEARLAEKAAIAPIVELQGLFHLRGVWWAEGAFGWSGRQDIDVGGFRSIDTVPKVLLGIGRIDFFPMFAGIRAVKEFGTGKVPHNIYARGGLSVVIANESPSRVHDTLMKYNIYNPGSEMAFGFAVGTGGEFHYYRNFALVADIQYRYVRFNYARRAKFDLSGFWFSAGLAIRTR